MALRPVSDLGLVDVTDVAGAGAGDEARATRAPAAQRKPPKRKRPSESRSRTSPRPAPAASPEKRARPAQSAKSAEPGVASLRTSILSGVIGVAGAVLVGRAVLRH